MIGGSESTGSFGVEPRRAATLVLVRDTASGMEVFLTIRPRHLRFMGGTTVFPGGALDPADLDERWDALSSIDAEEAAERLREDDERVALGAHVCALRESFEEVGFIIGTGVDHLTRSDAEDPARWLDRCLESSAVLGTDRLVPAGRWVTPVGAPVRFDTWFFVTSVDPSWVATPDPDEVDRCMWITPQGALDELAEGELLMAPPTIEMLQRLAGYATTEAAATDLNRDRLTGAGAIISFRLSPLVQLVLAPNPGVMTGPGTNSYVVGSGPTVVIDPAVDEAPYLEELLKAAGEVDQILITHRHEDHVGGAEALARMTGAPVRAFGSFPAGTATVVPLADEETIDAGEARLRALHTPGHASDHMSFFFEGAASLFSGDNILGEGTSVIAPPDGNMRDFLSSLTRVSKLPLDRIYPAHFRPLDGGRHIIEELLAHRRAREAAIVQSIKGDALTAEEIVDRVYQDTPSHLHPIALFSVLAHLEMLEQEGTARNENGRWSAPTAG